MNKKRKIQRAFEAMACVSTHYQSIDPDTEDADDLVETLVLTNSLIECGGLDHRHIVNAFRNGLQIEINGKIVKSSGNRDKSSQMAKLRASTDPFYLADDGDTNGAAMHILPVALFFTDLEEMIYAANFVARITHASAASRMAAVAMALAYRTKLLNLECDEAFHRQIISAGQKLGMSDAANYLAALLTMHSGNAIVNLSTPVGFGHAAMSAPVAALAVHNNGESVALNFLKQPPPGPHMVSSLRENPFESTYIVNGKRDQLKYADSLRAKSSTVDADTFYSMLMTLSALSQDANLPPTLPHKVFYGFNYIIERLARRWP